MTAVNEDELICKNPCRITRADQEKPASPTPGHLPADHLLQAKRPPWQLLPSWQWLRATKFVDRSEPRTDSGSGAGT